MTDHHDEHQGAHYPDAIEQYRADKDAYFRNGAGSPVPAAERATFTGIPYWAVDEALIVDGLALEPYAGNEPVRFEIPTTDGRLRPAERAGVFRFRLLDTDCSLTAYRMASAERHGPREPVRPVPRRHHGRRVVRRRALPGPRRRGRRHLVAGLQRRLPPLVRVRPAVLVPAHPGREPAADPGSRPASAFPPPSLGPSEGH